MTSFLSGCLLFFSFLTLCGGQEPGDVLGLTGDRPISAVLTQEHPATLRLAMTGSEAEEIILDVAGPDIAYRIVASDGTEIFSGRLATFGWAVIPVPMISAGRREVQIQLKTESGAEGLRSVPVRAQAFPVSLRSWPEQVGAAQAFNAAQPLHRTLRAEDLRQAIGQFQQAASEWARAGDLYGEALALGGKGESEIELSRYADAKLTLQRALVLAGKNAYLRGWLLHLAARLLFDQWQGKQAKDYAEEEMRLGKGIHDSALIAQAQTDLAGVAFWLRDSKMDEIVNLAHTEAIAAGVPETLALERRWKNWVDEYYERIAPGMTELREAEAYFRQAGDRRNALEAALEIAEADSLNGDFYSALARFWKLDPLFRGSGNAMDYGNNLVNIGIQYKELNKPRLAEAYFRRADAAYRGAHILFGRMLSHQSLCETELQENETANAHYDCHLALSFARQFGDAGFLGSVLCDLGIFERKAGSLSRAVKDLTEAVKVTQTIQDSRYKSQEHIQLGELLDQQGNWQYALTEFQNAESLSEGVADPASRLEAQYAVARWYARDGQFAMADTKLAPALKQLETTRQSVSNSTLQASYFAAERKCYQLAVELQMRQFEREKAGGGDARALVMSERSRARGLLDALSARAASGAGESGEAETRRMRAKLLVDRAFDRRLKLLVEGGARRDLEANSAELTHVLGDLERAEDDAHAAAIRASKPAQPMTADEIEQASLGSNTTFFEYALGTEHSYLWVIGGGKRKSYVLLPREQLENMVKQWRALATSQERGEANVRAKFRHLALKLSCALLADAVEPGMTKMVIVPDGDLAILPFAALPEDGCSRASGEPLVVGHQIAMTPSLSVFLTHKPTAENGTFQGEIAIVADPVFDAADSRAIALNLRNHKAGLRPEGSGETELPRLLNTGREASAIRATVRQATGDGQVFLAQGFDASVETVLRPAIRGYRVWHLATHGVYDQSVPEFSGLVFSLLGRDGNPRFGFLKAHDIAQLNVPAELVVLSACDSAAGENVNGEGVMGLSYAFLHAGAKQVISTLWNVDDAKSKELMVAFYREYIRNGRNAAQALRQSQLTVMRLHNSAPYYWAGFELTSAGE